MGTAGAVRLIAFAVAEVDDNQADWLQAGTYDALVGPDGVPDVAAACGNPARGQASARVHDRYERRLQDLPSAGHAVRILLSVRRFVCADGACPQRTFAEQIPALTSPYARVTERLGVLLDRIALALADRAGARMANALGLTVRWVGLLNRIRALPDPFYDPPRVLGVDDFATRRGHP
ncbi:transposase family protein [Streptomyces sp. NPDC093544]|uniref:transposase family protein n=1 Tax=Streptomyces sp. NPDC093544 TaxID=3155200 RepID=UPI00341A1251